MKQFTANSGEEIIINEIIRKKRNDIDSLLSLTESPIERLFLLLLIKYFENTLSQNPDLGATKNDGIKYIISWDIFQPDIAPRMLGFQVTCTSVGFIMNTDLNKVAPEVRKSFGDPYDRTSRERGMLLDENGKFTAIQYLEIFPQYPVKVGNEFFRLDFAFLLYENIDHEFRLVKKIGIECDGYDFHSDKQDFTRDRDRMRKLTAKNWIILPFSGSKIHSYINDFEGFEKEIYNIGSLLGFSDHR